MAVQYDLGTARGVIHFAYDGGGIQKAQKDMSSVDDHSTKMSRHLGSVALGLGRVGLVAGAVVAGATVAVGAIAGLGLKTSSQMEQANIAFTTMLGSGAKAQAFLSDLADFAAKTPFEFPDLVSASQKLLAMGFQAKQVRPLLTAIGDAVAGLGGGAEQIDQVTRALGQMQAKGKVQSDEMLQLTEAGIPAWQMLAEAMGTSVAAAMDKVSKGQVAAGTMVEAFMKGSNKRFGGMMDKQSQTLAGLWSTLKDTAQMGLASAESAVMPAMKKMITDLIAAVDPLMKQLGPLMLALGPVVTTLADQLAPLLGSIASALGPAAPQIATMLNLVVGGLSDLIKQLAPAMPDLMGFVNDVLRGILGALKDLAPVVGPVFKSLGSLAGVFGDILAVVAPIIARILPPLADLLSKVFDAIDPLIKPFGDFANLIADFLVQALSDLQPYILDITSAMVDMLPSLLPVAKSLLDLAVAILPVLLPLVDILVRELQDLLPLIVPLARGFTKEFTLAAQLVLISVGGFITAFRLLGDGFFEVVQKILEVGSHLPFVGKYFAEANTAVKEAHTNFDTNLNQWAGTAFTGAQAIGTATTTGVTSGLNLGSPAMTTRASVIGGSVGSSLATGVGTGLDNYMGPVLGRVPGNYMGPVLGRATKSGFVTGQVYAGGVGAGLDSFMGPVLGRVPDNYMGPVLGRTTRSGHDAGGQYAAGLGAGLDSFMGPVLGRVPGNYMGPVLGRATTSGAQVAGNLTEGLKVGIEQTTNRAQAAANLFVANVIHQMHMSAEAQSPSKLTMAIGEDLAMGMLGGIENKQLEVMKAAGVFAQAVAGQMGAVAGSMAQYQAMGQQMAGIYGWGSGAQWNALNNLVMGESGWNPNAQNPTSSAYGIAQNIGGRSGYPDPSPHGQILWLLQYIAQRYGSPLKAWQMWLSRSPHWYDQGGFLPSDRPALVGVPELWIPKVNGAMFPLDKMGGRPVSISFGDINVTGSADPEETAEMVMDKLEREALPRIVRAMKVR